MDETIAHDLSPSSVRVYGDAVRLLRAYLERAGRTEREVDEDTLVGWLLDLYAAGYSRETIKVRLSGARWWLGTQGLPTHEGSPRVRATLSRVRRALAGVPPRKAAPVDLDRTREVCEWIATYLRRRTLTRAERLRALRDLSLLTLGWSAALRRSEIVALLVVHLTWSGDDLAIYLPRSKGDQLGAGQWVGIPAGAPAALDPIRHLRAWLDAAEITSGPVYRRVWRRGEVSERPLHDSTVREIVRRWIPGDRISPHSLRRGLLTQGFRAGAAAVDVRDHARHKHLDTTLIYREEASALHERNALLAIWAHDRKRGTR